MPKQDESFLEFWEQFTERVFEHKISLEEIEKQTQIDPELMTIIFNEKSEVISAIARLIAFGNFQMKFRRMMSRWYTIEVGETQIKVVRTIYPRCSIRYEKDTDIYFDFQMKKKREKISEEYKQLIISQMKKYVDKNKEKIRKATYNI